MAVSLNEKYQPLFTTKKRYIIVTGGRGSGKSFGVTTFLLLLTYELSHRILFTRYTLISAEISIIPEFIDKIVRLCVEFVFSVIKHSIKNNRTGVEILFRGIKTSSGVQTANLKSLQGITTWVVDEAEEVPDKETFDKIDLSIRETSAQNRVILILNPTTRDHWIWQWAFEHTHRIEMIDGVPVPISTHPDVEHIHTTYLDNIENLSESFLKTIEDIKTTDSQRYAHEIIGGWQLNPEGALFKREELRRFKKSEIRKSEAEAIMGYIDVADQGDDSYCFPVAHIYNNKVFITDVLFTKDGIDITLPSSEQLINAQTIYDDKKVIQKQFDYVRVEANNQGGEILRGLRRKFDPSKILGVTNTANKHTRIMMSRNFVLRYCHFLDESEYERGSDYDMFMREIFNYLKDGKSKHDDAPDALSGLTTMVSSFLPHLFMEI